jgi:hypothetical protein
VKIAQRFNVGRDVFGRISPGGTADCQHHSTSGTISAVPPGLICLWIFTPTLKLKRWVIVKNPSGTSSSAHLMCSNLGALHRNVRTSFHFYNWLN